MPSYTNAWDVTSPAGTVQAKLIDDHIRRLRLDIQERMNSLVEDWTDDPVILKDVLAGKKDDDSIIIPFTKFVPADPDQGGWVSSTAVSTGNVYAPITGIPIGATITLVELVMTGSGKVWRVMRRAFSANPAASTTIDTVAHGAGTLALSQTVALTHVVAANDMLWLEIDHSGLGNITIMAARVTFDKPRVDA